MLAWVKENIVKNKARYYACLYTHTNTKYKDLNEEYLWWWIIQNYEFFDT